MPAPRILPCPFSVRVGLRSDVLLLLLLTTLLAPISAPAQEDDDPFDFKSGLVARYESADGQTAERLDEQISFAWGKSSPDARLPRGPFTAVWTGRLLTVPRGEYRLHAFLEGKVSIDFAGKPVLAGSATEPQWLTAEAVELVFGFQPLEVRF